MKAIHAIAFILLVIGGLNWLLVAFNFNLVTAIFGATSVASKIIYILVGVGALIEVFSHKKNCKCCEAAPKA
ncbi:MAG: DUF378 domain-containing protein [bacterium]